MIIHVNGIYKDIFNCNNILYAKIIDIDINDLNTVKIHYLGDPEDETFLVLNRNFIKEFEYIEPKNYHKHDRLQKLLDEEMIKEIIE